MSASSVVDRRRSPDAVLGPPDAADARADDHGDRTTTSVPVPPPARSLPSTFPSFGLFASCTVLLVGVVTSLVFSGVGRDYEVSERTGEGGGKFDVSLSKCICRTTIFVLVGY